MPCNKLLTNQAFLTLYWGILALVRFCMDLVAVGQYYHNLGPILEGATSYSVSERLIFFAVATYLNNWDGYLSLSEFTHADHLHRIHRSCHRFSYPHIHYLVTEFSLNIKEIICYKYHNFICSSVASNTCLVETTRHIPCKCKNLNNQQNVAFSAAIDHTLHQFTDVKTDVRCWENIQKVCKSWAIGQWFTKFPNIDIMAYIKNKIKMVSLILSLMYIYICFWTVIFFGSQHPSCYSTHLQDVWSNKFWSI